MAKSLFAAATLMVVLLSGCFGPFDTYQGEVREIKFWVEQMDWEIHPGVTTQVWAFCAEGDGVEPVWDGPCGVPGPTIRVTAGDTIRLTFENTHAIPHTVHFHGWHPFVSDQNGQALLGDAMVTDPGETEVLEWVAEPRGSFIYHCHFDTPTHMDMGMYGLFIVEDPTEEEKPDREYPVILDEWQIRDTPDWNGNIPAYNYFTINGKSFPLTQPIYADPGETVRLHMVNAGYEFHAMHVHGYTPVAYEGVAGPEAGFLTDVKAIAPGQTIVLDFTADREGAWLFHDHVVPRVTAASDGTGFGAYPRGMLTAVIVGEAYLDALVDIAPTLVEAAQGDTDDPVGHAEAPQAAPDAQDPSSPGVVVFESEMVNFAFESPIEISAGTTVTWSNSDSVFHTVTDAAGGFDSGEVQPGQSWSRVFDEPGTYKVYCKPHSYADSETGEWKGMVGTIIVS